MIDGFDAVPEIQLADGVIRAHAFREQWPEAARVATADYEGVKQKIQTQYDDKIKLIESREAQLLSMHEQAKAFLETVKGQFTLSFDGAGEQLENIRKSYDERMALRAPVEYWAKKSKSHLKASWWFGGFLVLYLTAALIGLWELVQIWASKEVVSPELMEKRLFPQLPNYSLAFVLLAAFVAFWCARILVRIVLSHLHLYFDAEQRVVMTQTYLALIREGSLTTDDGRESVLRALFRPTATGIVRDDAVPPTPMGAAMRGAG